MKWKWNNWKKSKGPASNVARVPVQTVFLGLKCNSINDTDVSWIATATGVQNFLNNEAIF